MAGDINDWSNICSFWRAWCRVLDCWNID